MELFRGQLMLVLRRLWRTPMFTLLTLITLAAGIGANTAVFSVVESVLLKPLPYPHAEQLIGIWHTASGFSVGDVNMADVNMAPSNYFIYREQNHAFEDIGLYQGDSVNVTGVAQPEQVRALDVTDGTLSILGVAPVLGRSFNRTDGLPGSPDTAILTFGYWRKKFGSDRSIVGRSITVDGKLRQIIGVMPQSFQFLDWEEPELILPLQLDRNKTTLGQFSYEGIARLKPGATLADADKDIARMLPSVWGSFPAPHGFSVELFKQAKINPHVRPLKQDVVGDVDKLLWVLMGSIGVVLLIACANVANLLLVRTEGRQQELAIRAALGANRSRIGGEILMESIVLGLLGSVTGLVFAYGALRLLTAMAPAGLPRLHEIGIDVPVLLFNFAVSVVASLFFGLIPVLRYSGTQLRTGLREGGRTSSQSRERHRTRSMLVVVQVALAFVLLICSGLTVRTFLALTQVNPGFASTAKIQTLRITIPVAEVPDAEKVVRMQEAMMRKISAIPGVSSVGLTSAFPMDGNHWQDPVFAQDRNYADGSIPPLRQFKFVSPEFFKTLQIPLIAGRDFTWIETYQKLPVAIISENFAREYWHDPANALGKRVRVGTDDAWREIVGVVGDIHNDGMSQSAPSLAYWPILVDHFEGGTQVDARRTLVFVIRSPRAGSESLMKEVRQAVWSVDANLPLANVRTLDYFYTQSMARTSFTLVMLAIAGSMALLLGTVGLYGVIAYSVSQRKREIGVRIALGALHKDITGMFVRQGLFLTGIGVACGLIVAMAATRLMSSLLFQVSLIDPVTYVLACCGLAAAALLASYIPSRRTAAMDPVEALRAE